MEFCRVLARSCSGLLLEERPKAQASWRASLRTSSSTLPFRYRTTSAGDSGRNGFMAAQLVAKGRVRVAAFLKEPPADTLVLVGYVRSRSHLDWIHTKRLYNLRADGRPGTISGASMVAPLLLLWGAPLGRKRYTTELWHVDKSPELMTRDALFALGYPAPTGHLYHCIRLVGPAQVAASGEVGIDQVRRVLHSLTPTVAPGAPFVISWQELVAQSVPPSPKSAD